MSVENFRLLRFVTLPSGSCLVLILLRSIFLNFLNWLLLNLLHCIIPHPCEMVGGASSFLGVDVGVGGYGIDCFYGFVRFSFPRELERVYCLY